MCFSTPPRIYRQVASLVGLQLVTSFITVAKTLGGQRETTQRQLNAEKKKRSDGPRVESLNKRLSITHEMITVTEEMMRKIFTGWEMLLFRKFCFFTCTVFWALFFFFSNKILKFCFLQTVYAQVSGCWSWHQDVVHQISWYLDFIISLIILAGFILKVSWMDSKWQSKLTYTQVNSGVLF